MEEKVEPRIGQRVLLTSLAWGGPFPGRIVAIASLTGLAWVKLDQAYRPVANVKFFEDEPNIVDGRYWQICCPDPEHEEEKDEMPRVQE